MDCNSISGDTDAAGRVSIAPGEGVAMFVVRSDVLHQLPAHDTANSASTLIEPDKMQTEASELRS